MQDSTINRMHECKDQAGIDHIDLYSVDYTSEVFIALRLEGGNSDTLLYYLDVAVSVGLSGFAVYESCESGRFAQARFNAVVPANTDSL